MYSIYTVSCVSSVAAALIVLQNLYCALINFSSYRLCTLSCLLLLHFCTYAVCDRLRVVLNWHLSANSMATEYIDSFHLKKVSSEDANHIRSLSW